MNEKELNELYDEIFNEISQVVFKRCKKGEMVIATGMVNLITNNKITVERGFKVVTGTKTTYLTEDKK